MIHVYVYIHAYYGALIKSDANVVLRSRYLLILTVTFISRVGV